MVECLSDKKMSWLVAFVDFCDMNVASMADPRLPMWCWECEMEGGEQHLFMSSYQLAAGCNCCPTTSNLPSDLIGAVQHPHTSFCTWEMNKTLRHSRRGANTLHLPRTQILTLVFGGGYCYKVSLHYLCPVKLLIFSTFLELWLRFF